MKAGNITLSTLQYWLGLAEAAAEKSNDIHTKVGAVLMSYSHGGVTYVSGCNTIIGADKNPSRLERPIKYSYSVHAEQNVIIEFLMDEGDSHEVFVPSGTFDGIDEALILFCTHIPCANCAKLINQTRISDVYVYDRQTSSQPRGEVVTVKNILTEGGKNLHLYDRCREIVSYHSDRKCVTSYLEDRED